MARMARVVIPDVPHHVTQRGNRRQRTFFSDADYQHYICLIAEAAHRARTDVWAYCLMPNHVHFVMVPATKDGLRDTFAEAHRRYTRYVNFREGWRGHLWQERFHSFPMDEDYLMATVRYVERNPVAANLCAQSEEWRWSSAVAHLEGRNDQLVNVQPMLSRVNDWAEYLGTTGEMKEQELISKHSRTGRPLGSDLFLSQLEKYTGRTLRQKKPGRQVLTGN